MVSIEAKENGVDAMVSRTGRHLQRYNKLGRRLVVGCIPYRHKVDAQSCLKKEEEVEVLVISSQRGNGMLFPKGGWEMDETIKEAASRETLEEAGVRGIVEQRLGRWSFKSKTYDAYYEGYMFPLLVLEELDIWPEQSARQRTWMNVAEAQKVCRHWWMKEALNVLVERLLAAQQKLEHQKLEHQKLEHQKLEHQKLEQQQRKEEKNMEASFPT